LRSAFTNLTHFATCSKVSQSSVRSAPGSRFADEETIKRNKTRYFGQVTSRRSSATKRTNTYITIYRSGRKYWE